VSTRTTRRYSSEQERERFNLAGEYIVGRDQSDSSIRLSLDEYASLLRSFGSIAQTFVREPEVDDPHVGHFTDTEIDGLISVLGEE